MNAKDHYQAFLDTSTSNLRASSNSVTVTWPSFPGKIMLVVNHSRLARGSAAKFTATATAFLTGGTIEIIDSQEHFSPSCTNNPCYARDTEHGRDTYTAYLLDA